jgi:UDP-N-acetylmuramoyl-tripeptide--D-alanyl-D-alanine ligase
MIVRSLGALALLLGGRLIPGDGDGGRGRGDDADRARAIEVLAIMTDSRRPSPVPALFVALPTDRADGHAHVAAAAGAGAVAALVTRVVPGCRVPQLVVADTWVALGLLARDVLDASGARVVAITGSYGKTTTKDLIRAALAADRRTVASVASYNNELGVPLTMLEVSADTEVLVAEVGARLAGDIDAMATLLRPEVAVVTAVGPVHLETFGDETGVAAEKGRLVANLRPGGTAVLNGDDARVTVMLPPAGQVLRVSAAGDTAADVRAEEVRLDPAGRVRASVITPWGSCQLTVPLPGRHHLGNALLAIGAAGVLGVGPERAAAGIAAATTSASRAELHEVAGVLILDDSYNASPPTVLGALATLRDVGAGQGAARLQAVLGTMAELGPGSRARHEEVGRACVGVLDRLVVVGEEAAAIADAAAAAGMPPARIVRCADRATAAAALRADLRAGDVVLLKGSRVVGLDEVARDVLAALRSGHAGGDDA